MALKTFRPTSAGLRHLVQVDRSHLYKGAPVKMLTEGKRKTGGRNSDGRITTRHIGGGHKQSYRLIDFKRRKHDVVATVERLEYDPNRTAFIALIKYKDGHLSYILAPQRLQVGDQVVSGQKVDVKPGNAMPLSAMPIGTIVHNVELKPGGGGQIARSAGAFVQLVGRDSAGLCSSSTQVRRARFAPSAWRRSAPSRTRTTPTKSSARPVVSAEGQPSDGSLDRDEPDRPSERWPYQGR